MSYDIVIRNGRIVDGSGADAFIGDIAINGETIAAVGTNIGPGDKEIDAQGLLVTPGWVDIHTHYDGQAAWDPYLTPSSWHGATTVVMGNCGVGFAPAKPDQRDWLISLMESVEDIPGAALSEGLPWDWESFPEYLDSLDRIPRAIDVGTQVPHCAVRSYVMGERCLTETTAGPEDISAMQGIVKEGLEAGALGFSTSRTVIHRTKEGEAIPGTFAGTEEMMGLGAAVHAAGHGVFQVASDFSEDLSEIAMLSAVSVENHVPVSVGILQNDFQPQQWRDVLKKIETANAGGANVIAQVAGRTTGMLMCLEGTLSPFSGRPTYEAMQQLPLDQRLVQLRDPQVKAQILSESLPETGHESLGFLLYLTSSWQKMFPFGEDIDYEPPAEASFESLAVERGCTPQELAYDQLLANDGRGMIYFPFLNYFDNNFDAMREMMLHPDARFGLSDGGAHCGVVCDVSMPSYLLTYWVRDRTRGERLPLEWIVHKQTRDTASLFGLLDRGLLQPGYRADINLIDFERLEIGQPHMAYDLPTDARRLVQRVEGYRMTLCAGQIIYQDGVETGNLPGKLIRGPQADPVAQKSAA